MSSLISVRSRQLNVLLSCYTVPTSELCRFTYSSDWNTRIDDQTQQPLMTYVPTEIMVVIVLQVDNCSQKRMDCDHRHPERSCEGGSTTQDTSVAV